MKGIVIISLLGFYFPIYGQVMPKVSGKIVDNTLNCLTGVVIRNLNSKVESISDQNGQFEIVAAKNDRLIFRYVGLTTDTVLVLNEKINLIMMYKDINCLGAIWTKRMYRKAQRRIENELKKTYKIAEKRNIWNNKTC